MQIKKWNKQRQSMKKKHLHKSMKQKALFKQTALVIAANNIK